MQLLSSAFQTIMILRRLSLLYLIVLLFVTPAFSSTSIPMPVPASGSGCQDRCGNIPIPFPFGVGPNCSLNIFFSIFCNTSTNPPKPYLHSFNNFEVVEINLNRSQIRISYPKLLDLACYNKSSGHRLHGAAADAWTGLSFSTSPFTFSSENWLTAIGCDDLVLGLGENKKIFGSGCVSHCNDVGGPGSVGFCPDNDVGYPPANGCCRTTVPGGIADLGAQLTDLGKKWRRAKLFSCSYVFIQEKGLANKSNFSYPLYYLNDPKAFLDDRWSWKIGTPRPVMRLDWRIIESDNCSQARRSPSSYVCPDYSTCVDFDANVGGYLCRCNEGYQGNPYLADGCRDIDECADSRNNPCDSNSICTNVPGSVTCSCSKGYYGDGRKNGRGCIRLRIIDIYIGVGSGLGLLLLVSMCCLLRKALKKRQKRLRKETFFKQNGGILLQQQQTNTFGKTKLFLAEELEKATDKFNKSRIIGQGGQGIVYKGMLSNGKIVAIKKSKLVDKDQLDQFINEVVILSQINHRNVVELLGCCLETEIPLLVYEFLPNGNLSDLIGNSKTTFPIVWNMRLKIAADVAGALAYLHSASSTSIYHRDIKSSNILLDEKYVVKVSDFGISRNVGVDQTHLTTQVKGTFGYFDPEYFQSNQFTEKSDVYSFGVVLVELLTGEKPISLEREDEQMSLVTRFLASVEDHNVDEILDAQVLEQGRKEEVSAVVMLARRCLNLQGKMRPTMKEVATELESLRLSEMPPIESEEVRAYEAKTMLISDIDYSWTTSDISELPSSSSSSSDIRPFRI